MILYRPFLNSDPPAIAEIWRSQHPSPGLMQTMTAATLDECVFSKPYFDRAGLILAIEDDKPIGFVHAGFGPTDDGSELDETLGVTSLLLGSPHPQAPRIAVDLLAASEDYLRSRGAAVLHGGGTAQLGPFYFGLYGGSGLPGVLATDQGMLDVFEQAGYERELYCEVQRRDLAGFRPPMDRHLMQVRREFQLGQADDPLPTDWWDGCAFGHTDRLRFLLTSKSGDGADEAAAAKASFWDIEPLASSWGVHAMGLVDFQIEQEIGTPAVATFFLGEILRQLASYGTTLVEIQVASRQTLLSEACQQLGFELHDRGFCFHKRPA
ncbi:MAG: hypothetical protein CMJ64_07280 [Planctomycetaceae bacterium]|nr:hypothetical protein [Planctomycetaceae bacterium]